MLPVDPPAEELRSLGAVLERLERAARRQDEVSVADLQAAIGKRSFGPLLLVPGLVVLSPLSGIPTLPTFAAGILLLIAVQILGGRTSIWLPGRLARRTLPRHGLLKALAILEPGARVADRFVKPRLRILTGFWGIKAVALVCLLIAVTMPPLEILPFINSGAGLVIVIFALGITAHDGILVLAGLVITLAVLVAGGTILG
ncbi:exopolysaccharide biosynthesis protein [Geminicoccus roseus]|uniref:exopolysaccharide biosynthesis protein n=1 Tax=Geminicoccus roseus TaxID=404900 RepID=UPI00048985F5|nr:exopolysaccharide biosynthesis protein [Geminicoccus roseus]